MSSKEFFTRIQMKRDTSSNWVANNPVLLDGEIVIVDTDAGEVRYKVGDGTKKYTQLPFTDESMLNLVNNKQDKLTIDVLPVAGSPNPVTSDGIKTYVDDGLSELSSDLEDAVADTLSDAKTYANSQIAVHNTASGAHQDIRASLTDLTTKVNAFLDVDEETSDQLSEVLAMIDANEGTIESLISNKVNVSDIVNNLTTNSATKVLSAAQGVAIQSLINTVDSALDTHVANKSNPHSVTKSQVGLGNVDNTSDANKPVSTAQATAIADAKAAGTSAQTNLNTHTANKSNPHSVTLSQLGVTATVAELNIMDGVTATTAELNYVDGVTSNVQTQLNAKVSKSGDIMSGNLVMGGNAVVFGDCSVVYDSTNECLNFSFA